MMRATLLKAGNVNGFNVPRNLLKSLAERFKGKEILGQILGDGESFSGKLDPNKVSHAVKNIRYNNIADSLEADIEPLLTPFGEQLTLLIKKHPERLSCSPVYLKDQDDLAFITLNVIVR